MKVERTDLETVNCIGIWAMRVLLVAGVIACSIVGRDDAAFGLGVLAVASFVFLDSEP